MEITEPGPNPAPADPPKLPHLCIPHLIWYSTIRKFQQGFIKNPNVSPEFYFLPFPSLHFNHLSAKILLTIPFQIWDSPCFVRTFLPLHGLFHTWIRESCSRVHWVPSTISIPTSLIEFYSSVRRVEDQCPPPFLS